MQLYTEKKHRFYYGSNLQSSLIKIKPLTDPGYTISGMKKDTFKECDISISISPISRGNSLFVATDGLYDAFVKDNEINDEDGWKSKLNQTQLSEYLKHYKGTSLAKDLLLEAYSITKKPDDITVIHLEIN
jgi:hypothetical protein